MPRFDIARLRKKKGMSQNELAQQLQMTQSFLSAIENGKSPLPVEKEERLCEIFNLPNLADYIADQKNDLQDRKVTEMTDSDLFNQLLSRFHKQAHSAEGDHHHHNHHEKIESLEEKVEALYLRNDKLMQRNDKLNEKNDRLREENDKLRVEVENLRSEIFSLNKQLMHS